MGKKGKSEVEKQKMDQIREKIKGMDNPPAEKLNFNALLISDSTYKTQK